MKLKPRPMPECSLGFPCKRQEDGTYNAHALWNYVGGWSYTKDGKKALPHKIRETSITYASKDALKLAHRFYILATRGRFCKHG